MGQAISRRGMRPHRPRQVQQDASIDGADQVASPARLRTKSKRWQTKRRLPAKVATQPPPAVPVSFYRGRQSDRLLPQGMVAKHERGHRFDYWDRARQNTRIVASASGELRLFTRYVNGFLFVRDRRCRLKSDAKVNFLAIADPALHTARNICRCPD